jgi:hypothetical protein
VRDTLEELVVGGLLLVLSKPVGRPLALGLCGVTWAVTKAVELLEADRD